MRLISVLHSAVLGVPTLMCLFAVFLFLNIKTRFVGIRKIYAALKAPLSKVGSERKNSPLKAACVSLSATVGTGNIVGVAGAVTLGGAGAVFWMWVSAFLCLTVKFLEIYLSLLYKSRGGAYGYIYSIFKSSALVNTFLVFGIIAAFGIGNLTQTNAAASSGAIILGSTDIPPKTARLIVGIIFSFLCFVILRREGNALKFCERFLPLMAVAYIILCATALYLVRAALPQTVSSIFKGAVNAKAVTAGAPISFFTTMRAGVARGIFSNEAGLSTAALAYEKSDTKPSYTALFGIFEVFVDTIVLCTLTALVVLSSGAAVYGKDQGAYTTLCAFMSILGRKALFAVCPIICVFAFSSVIGWGIYARRFAQKLGLTPILLITAYAICCISGAVLRANSVWQIAEISSIFMMALNCTALICHSKELSYKKFGYKDRTHGKKRYYGQASAKKT